MNKMLVGINYTDDGSRVISRISFTVGNDSKLNEMGELFKYINDEAYIVDFDPNNIDFINEIVIKGCRI